MLSQYGFVRVMAHSPALKVGDVGYNVSQMVQALSRAEKSGVAVVLFPELSITGYTCGDLFLQPLLQKRAMQGLEQLCHANSPVAAIVGLPVMAGGRLYNCAAVVQSGRVLGIVPKTHLPNHQQFYEQRWFERGDRCPQYVNIGDHRVPMGTDLLFRAKDGRLCFGIEICEDLWSPSPPSGRLCRQGAQLIFNPSASDEAVDKHEKRKNLILAQSGRCIAGYVYAGAGPDESTTDLVFGGYTCAAENGKLLGEGPRFESGGITVCDVDVDKLNFLRARSITFAGGISEDAARVVEFVLPEGAKPPLLRTVSPHPFVPEGAQLDARCEEIAQIQVAALKKRMLHTGIKKAAVNVSGGLDSTLCFLIAARLFAQMGWDKADLHALTLPGLGTGQRTRGNALKLIQALGATLWEVDITPAVQQHFVDIGQDSSKHDITYENTQARERTQILMDYSNRIGALALGTGGLSESALGWSTYNGDHMSMYNVNTDVPKTLVRPLVRWLSAHYFTPDVLAVVEDIVDTPISPELIPSREGRIDQRTEDVLGPYTLHDFFLYHMLSGGASPAKLWLLAGQAFAGVYEPEMIKKALGTFIRRFFSQQFKRSCMPDGPRIGSVALSPRGDWRMPSDASAALWLEELDSIE